MMNDSFSLQGKIAVITGAAGILGQKFCQGLLNSGAKVAALDVSQKALEELEKNCSSKNLITHACDLSKEDEVVKAYAFVETNFGVPHVLHNNAASKTSSLEKYFDKFEDYSLSTWKEVMSVNVDSYFLCAKVFGSKMVEAGVKGSIIQTSSIYGLVAPNQNIYEGSYYMDRQINTPAVYSTSKAAVIGLSKFLATYWGDKGIRVNSLIPGGVFSGQNETFINKYSARVPLGKMADEEDMVNALIFLASDASKYITGQDFVVDGGLSAW